MQTSETPPVFDLPPIRINLKLLIGLGIAALLLVIWTIISYQFGGLAQENMKNLVIHSCGKNWEQDRGLFASTGSFDLDCSDKGSSHIHVNYVMSHFFLPTSIAKLRWEARLDLEQASQAEAILLANLKLIGEAKFGLSGKVEGEFNLAPKNYQDNNQGISFKINSSVGHFTREKKAVHVDWQLQDASFMAKNKSASAKNAVVKADYSAFDAGVGKVELALGQLVANLNSGNPNASNTIALEGLKLQKNATVNQGRFDIIGDLSLDQLTTSEKRITQAKSQAAVHGLDTASLTTLNNQACFDNLRNKSVCDPLVLALINKGFTANLDFGAVVTHVTDASKDGAIDEKLLMKATPTTAPTAGQTLSSSDPTSTSLKNISLDHRLSFNANLLPKDILNYGVKENFGVIKGGDFVSTLQYSAAGLVVNGKPETATHISTLMTKIISLLTLFNNQTALPPLPSVTPVPKQNHL